MTEKQYKDMVEKINMISTRNGTQPCGYILNEEKEIIPCYDFEELSIFIMKPFSQTRRVDQTQIGKYRVYTSFLTNDHNFCMLDSRPILFETMITRDKKWLDYQKRYRTWDEAVAGHEKTCALVKRWIAKRKAKEQTP